MKITEILCEDVDLLNEGPKLDAMKRAAKSVGRGISNVATGAAATAAGVPGAAAGGLIRGYKQARSGKSFLEPQEKPPVQAQPAQVQQPTASQQRRASRYGSPERYRQPADAQTAQQPTGTPQAAPKAAKPASAYVQLKKQVDQMSAADQQKLIKYLQTKVAKQQAAPKQKPTAPKTAPVAAQPTARKQPARKAPVKKPVAV
jgi:hypothetical protein